MEKETDMGTLIQLPQSPLAQNQHYYRATEKARLPGMCDAIHGRSLRLYDILMLCLRGAWELELRQFMPPSSLAETVQSLIALGLIESVEDPPPMPSMERPARSGASANQPTYARYSANAMA
jgi:hypothetical protein